MNLSNEPTPKSCISRKPKAFFNVLIISVLKKFIREFVAKFLFGLAQHLKAINH